MTENEKYALNWFNNNGFSYKLYKNKGDFVYYEFCKYGIKDIFYVDKKDTNIKKTMKRFNNNFELYCTLKDRGIL